MSNELTRERDEHKEMAEWFLALVPLANIGTVKTPSLRAYIEQLQQRGMQIDDLTAKLAHETELVAHLRIDLAAVTQGRDEARQSKNQCVIDLYRQLDARDARIKELQEWQRIVTGAGTGQESVVRMAAAEYTKTAVQCWRDKVAQLEQQLTTLRNVVEHVAGMPGKDWLAGQLMLAEALTPPAAGEKEEA